MDHGRIRAACATVLSHTTLRGTVGEATALEQMLEQPNFRALAIEAAFLRARRDRSAAERAELAEAIDLLERYEGAPI